MDKFARLVSISMQFLTIGLKVSHLFCWSAWFHFMSFVGNNHFDASFPMLAIFFSVPTDNNYRRAYAFCSVIDATELFTKRLQLYLN